MVNASRRAGLGRTLQKVQNLANQRRNPRKTDRHTVDPNPDNDSRLKLKSVTAQTNLDEFFEEADLAGKQFITERRNVIRIDEGDQRVDVYDDDERLEDIPKAKLEDIDRATSLAVPRRPKWDANTTPEQLNEMEKLTFLTWRKKIAKLQENDNVVLTPFEKNIEVWRQLWRVVERSDVVVQILDCRNPLLYLCNDLIKYVKEEFEGKKMNLILLNKADYLSKEQRQMWLDYFKKQDLKVVFFSALLECANIPNSGRRVSESENNQSQDDSDSEDSSDREEVADSLDKSLKLADPKPEDETRIYNKFELLDLWHDLLKGSYFSRSEIDVAPDSEDSGGQSKVSDAASEHTPHNMLPPTVGLVGYPNVGKSSTINALLSAKRVAVSATPGKTKHFQTFFIDKDLMLCDCPGLVFPNFVGCKSEMVVNGVLPIDQMKDHIGPVRLIVDRIPRAFLEGIYGLAFDIDAKQNIVAEDLLNAFGFMRGYMTARGLPDTSRAARKICKDYINGKILYCEPPPDADRKLYHSHSKLSEAMRRIEESCRDPKTALMITERQRRLMAQAKGTQIKSRNFDAQFLLANSTEVHIKGLPGIGNMTQPIGSHQEIKVYKREKKHKKREKLRVVYRDLDL